tara:strand:+ start:3014 stop:3223 length:210 start_codon:yes stop_codon:yes gene_type:complete
MEPVVNSTVKMSRNWVGTRGNRLSLFSFSFIGLPYLVLVYKDSTSPQQRTAQDWDPEGTAGGKVLEESP